MKKLFLVLFSCLFTGLFTVTGQEIRFAICVDPDSYRKATAEIEGYRSVLDGEGLRTRVIIDRWHHPDSLRKVLRSLYLSEKAFEGAVFVGNIPVPMLRDAQHMCSAFKMDQDRYRWNRSSVPSDRFYEDFSLGFDFLEQDKADTSLFYYSLKWDSPQVLKPEIYSGRIRIPDDPEGKKLRAYLEKVIAAHREPERVDHLLLFAGHGYNSESWVARMDEKVALLQQFPHLNSQGNGLKYIDHSFETHIKYTLLHQLAREELDLAILHHHGGARAQYLNGTPKVDGVTQSIENIKQYLRSKYRSAAERNGDLEATVQSYVDNLGVPEDWFGNSLDPEQMVLDSIFWNSMDISSEELDGYRSNARFILFDACFNGSFQLPDYQAARYVFGNGKTLAAQANSVNVIQDKFPDEMLGLLACGLRIGALNRYTCFLETHIIGDPTFRFSPLSGEFSAEALFASEGSTRKLFRLTGSAYPDVRSWAWRALFEKHHPGLSDLLYDAFMNSPFGVERMECLKILSEIRDDNFIRILQAGLSDSYELVRRHAAIFTWKSGDPRLVPYLARAVADPGCSKRVYYHLGDALGFFPKEILLEALDNDVQPCDGFGAGTTRMKELKGKVQSSWESYERYMQEIVSPDSNPKDRDFAIRALRNKTYHQGIPRLTAFLLACEDENTQVMLLEALGWYRYSYNRRQIIDTCKHIIQSPGYGERVKKEAGRTIRRLS